MCWLSRHAMRGSGCRLLEAMHAGTPVIAGDNSAMPEVVADAGLLLEADEADAWAEAIDEIVANESFANRLSAAGQARAKRYAPASAVSRLIDAWREPGSQRPVSVREQKRGQGVSAARERTRTEAGAGGLSGP